MLSDTLSLNPVLLEEIGKILLAGLLSGMIGIERLVTAKPAGIRTCILIGASSCLFTLISVEGFAGGVDPSRIAAQIVVGVGFLGGGSLLHMRQHVVGLTTAASIWTVAAVGMAVGVGMYGVALAMAFLALFTLLGLAPVSNWVERTWRLSIVPPASTPVFRVTRIAAARAPRPMLRKKAKKSVRK